MATTTIDPSRMEEFIGKVVGDFGAAVSAPLVLIGDQLGLFSTLAADGPLTSSDLAGKTGTSERYVREWLAAMTASEYVSYDATNQSFSMSEEQKAVFADPNSTFLMTGGYYSLSAVFNDAPLLLRAFRSGKGIDWGEHNGCLFCGTERFFRPSYRAHLLSEWLPALDGVVDRLERGCRVADVGCGHGASTMIMAERYPRSEFVGFDLHAPSVEHARHEAGQAGLANVKFEVASAKSYPGRWDLITFFDCLHDMGDPVGAAAHAYEALNGGGRVMIVEPRAGDRLEENLNPVGRVYYAFSTSVCTPCSLSQEVGAALGAQAGQAKLRDVLRGGGFHHVRLAAEGPFNIVLEAGK